MDEMYKLVIADDEIIIRHGLMSYKWDELGFKVLGAFPNGKKMLDFLENTQVDIILTDIKMPVMDGLELSRIVHDKYPACKIIFLTGYKEFEYAREAIKSGVYEYLLKPIDLVDLENLMKKLKEDLNTERDSLRMLSDYKLKLKESLPVAIDSFLKNLIDRKIVDLIEIEEKTSILELTFNKTFFVCAVFQIDAMFPPEEAFAEVEPQPLNKILKEYLYMQDIGYSFINNTTEIVAIFNFELESPNMSSYNYITSLISDIHSILSRSSYVQDHFSLSIGVGNIYNSIISISSSYNQAKVVLHRKFFDCETVLFYSWKEKSTLSKTILEYPIEKESLLLNAIMEGNMEESMHCMTEFEKEYSTNLNQLDPIHIHNIYLQFLNMLDRRLGKHGTSLEKLIPFDSPFISTVQSSRTLSELKSNIRNMITNVVNQINKINESISTSSHIAVQQALKLIESHFAEKITLHFVAAHVHLNPSYFSIQFKKETGKNFVEFLKECRMEKAKRLLKSGEFKVYEISELVGYNNTKYFTDAFKDYAGMSPLEYRQKQITN